MKLGKYKNVPSRYKTINNSKDKGKGSNLGPGSYGEHNGFGKNTKGGIIEPLSKKGPKKNNNPGPGTYNAERADKIVMAKSPSTKITNAEQLKSRSAKEIVPSPSAQTINVK
jgi:hypothetical protein